MKVNHRNPGSNWFDVPVSDPVDAGYEAEVRQSTDHAERDFRRAEARLARAERRLAVAARLRGAAARRVNLAALRDAVDARRAELEEIRKMMAPVISADKQIRHRTGRDDHLELGVCKAPERRQVAPGAVVTRKQAS